MVRPVRPFWLVFAAACAVYFGAFSTVAVHGLAQPSSAAPTAAQIAPFVGDWVATAGTDMMQSTSLVS
jgi:hypothetical protein